MQNSSKTLAIIPARAGSKRLPKKNIKKLAGDPLINWTIKAALGSENIDTVMVSTDCEEIQDIALRAGALAPFLRPAELSGDEASSSNVVMHAIDFMTSAHQQFDRAILLQPTSPLRDSSHIDEAFKLFNDTAASAVISVVKMSHPTEWANPLGARGEMDKFFESNHLSIRSQDLPVRFLVNGAIYIFDVSKFIEAGSYFFSSGTYAYVMGPLQSIDIDTEDDFRLCEMLIGENTNT